MKSLLHFCKFVLYIEPPDSQVTDRELSLLLQNASEAELVVEIGCYEGKTSVALAESCSGKVYSIDPFFAGKLGLSYGKLIAKIHARRRGVENLQFVQGFSIELAPEFQREIDFLFIDADHSYEAIKRDWKDWFPKVKPGGIIALHDCHQAANSPNYLGTMQFYDYDVPKIQGIEEIASIDSLVVFKVAK